VFAAASLDPYAEITDRAGPQGSSSLSTSPMMSPRPRRFLLLLDEGGMSIARPRSVISSSAPSAASPSGTSCPRPRRQPPPAKRTRPPGSPAPPLLGGRLGACRFRPRPRRGGREVRTVWHFGQTIGPCEVVELCGAIAQRRLVPSSGFATVRFLDGCKKGCFTWLVGRLCQ